MRITELLDTEQRTKAGELALDCGGLQYTPVHLINSQDIVFGGFDDLEHLVTVSVFQVVLDEAELHWICVGPRYRGHGIGQAMLQRSLAYLRSSRGIESCFLEVKHNNLAAIRLYEKCNFQRIGCRKGYYRASDGSMIDAITMKSNWEGI